jgi:uncharacterized protein (TIGR03435 family)
MMRFGLLVLLIAATSLPLAALQPSPAFDVASIKPNKSGDTRSSSSVQPGGHYIATNVTVRMLVRSAYGVQQESQLVGGPSWIDAERWDVIGKGEGNPSTDVFRDQARLMLRALLSDRFGLRVHSEQREIPIYALALAKDSGTLGPQLRRSAITDCSQEPKTGADTTMPCGGGFARAGHLAGRAVAFSTLVTNISNAADRPVVDRTGLSGTFDWTLQWSIEPLSQLGANTLFTALQEQLGLKLEPTRGPVDVLVIDSVERPTPD